ncbi:MAG TPA: Uma2 family endonuclease [Thermoanaerobaculia bacterium]|nr:Uma2 family endonuclease [Thermoanaerobaculia bacterium]
MKTTALERIPLDADHLEGNPDAPLVIPGVSEGEYYALDHGIHYQYLGGDLVKEPVGILHDGLNQFVVGLLREYVHAREAPGAGALVTNAGFPMRLDPKWSPEPDVMVIREERRHLVSRQRLEGPADLAIEIASYSHPRIDLKRKLPRYRQARVPEIWVIEPYAKLVQVEVLRADGPQGGDAAGAYETRTLSSGRLTTAALPGFWIEIAWLWQDPLPSVLACLRQVLA